MDHEYPDELFHLVGHSHPKDNEANYEILKKILVSRAIKCQVSEGDFSTITYDVNWSRRLKREELIVPKVTCYADILKDKLKNGHAGKYGNFGIGLKRSHLIKHGARPVIYIPTRSDDGTGIHGTTLLDDIEAIYHGFHEHIVNKLSIYDVPVRKMKEKPVNKEQAVNLMIGTFEKDFLAFIKPFDSELPANDSENYYMEREWRKFGDMDFRPEDVTHIIVAKGYKNKLEEQFPDYQSRVAEI